ncbi:MAG TPA: thiosulfate oxidation carrier complex protein SoxZ [Paracoccaceae bacterium]|nr:thiosulfate oxidation carrier complex protein SoxZ [Paracoccaceae bacterium]
MERPRVRLSASVIAAGETIEIRTLISHPMESGYRRDADGAVVPRKIITRFRCEFEGREVFTWELRPGVAANPYLQFRVLPPGSGQLAFTWTDDDGAEVSISESVTVA